MKRKRTARPVEDSSPDPLFAALDRLLAAATPVIGKVVSAYRTEHEDHPIVILADTNDPDSRQVVALADADVRIEESLDSGGNPTPVVCIALGYDKALRSVESIAHAASLGWTCRSSAADIWVIALAEGGRSESSMPNSALTLAD